MNYPDIEQICNVCRIRGLWCAYFNAAASITFNQDKKKKWLCEFRRKNVRSLPNVHKKRTEWSGPIAWDLKGAAEERFGAFTLVDGHAQLANGTIPFRKSFYD